MGVWGFSPENVGVTPFLEARKWLFWKPFPHGYSILEVKNSQYKFKRSRSRERNVEERMINVEKHETCIQVIAVIINESSKT